VAELLRVAADSNERLRRLIEDLLEVARAEERQMPLNRAEADLAAVVRNAVEEGRPRAERAELTLEAHYPEAPLVGAFDEAKIRRVVDNLLDNAIKHSLPGGRIWVTLVQQGTEGRVTVRDDGQGIPPHLHQRIFEKYGQAQAAREGQRMSVGLGLAFARLAVESHGGRIWVESDSGRGAAFTFVLPLTNQAAPPSVE
jgi:signal transduction histidine kinase